MLRAALHPVVDQVAQDVAARLPRDAWRRVILQIAESVKKKHNKQYQIV